MPVVTKYGSSRCSGMNTTVATASASATAK
jgi:hypothetical protein